MHVPEGYRRVEAGSEVAVIREDLAGLDLAELWVRAEALMGAKGRGGVGRSRLSTGQDVVLRDYRRGGVFGWLFRKSFFDSRRPQRELEILLQLRKAGIAAVEPIAALSARRWVGHRLRLATVLFANALPLPAFLAAHPALRSAAIRSAGRLVASAFAVGLWHHDLHPDNILARDGANGPALMLIDLDRAEMRDRLTQEAQDLMLVRMARYLIRHAGDMPITPRATEYLRFLAGMNLDSRQRREAMARILPRYRREIARHGLARTP